MSATVSYSSQVTSRQTLLNTVNRLIASQVLPALQIEEHDSRVSVTMPNPERGWMAGRLNFHCDPTGKVDYDGDLDRSPWFTDYRNRLLDEYVFQTNADAAIAAGGSVLQWPEMTAEGAIVGRFCMPAVV